VEKGSEGQEHYYGLRSHHEKPAWLKASVNSVETKEMESVSDRPTLSQAIKGPEWESLWKRATEEDFDNLEERGTGEEVSRDQIPSGAMVYPTKMVYVKKKNANNEFLKAKARMCVLRNLKTDVYTNIFAPTTNEKSLKLLFTIAIIFGSMVVGNS
jgi:hypothetical protein